MLPVSDGINFASWPAEVRVVADLVSQVTMTGSDVNAPVKTDCLCWLVTMKVSYLGGAIPDQRLAFDGSLTAESIIGCIGEETGGRCQNLDELRGRARDLQDKHDVLRDQLICEGVRRMMVKHNGKIGDAIARRR